MTTPTPAAAGEAEILGRIRDFFATADGARRVEIVAADHTAIQTACAGPGCGSATPAPRRRASSR